MIIAYDLGTGGNKASLYNHEGELLCATFDAYSTAYPQSGWHEQRPADWRAAVIASTRSLLEKSGVNPEEIECLALSGHSLGCVPIGKSGELLLDATPIWSDSRAGAQADAFFQSYDYTRWYNATGAGFPPAHYTLFKLLWYREHLPDMFAQMSTFLGTKDYINYWLTGRPATDFSYASGTGAYRLTNWAYDPEIIQTSGLPLKIFPEIVPSTEILGTLTEEAAAELGLPRRVRVAAGGVDNSCMALGAKCYVSGRSYASLGSSSWIAVSDAKPLLDNRFKPYVFTHVVPGQFASAIGVFSTGTTLKWIRDQFCRDLVLESEKTGQNVYARMMELAETESVPGSRGLILNPSFAGGSSLEPSNAMRGGLFNLDLSHTRADVIRAALEGIAFNLRKATDALGTLTTLEDKIVLVGGGAISPVWRKIYANVFHRSVEKTNIDQDAAALGAAALAAVGSGIWTDFSRIDSIHQTQEILPPDPDLAARYEALLPRFLRTAEMLTELAES